ncbi:unnamed protein product [Caenorhabditis brenneri]
MDLQNQSVFRPNFCDLPIELVDKIVKAVDLASRLTLRKVSKPLRSLVDSQKPIYNHIELYITSKFIKLTLEGHPVYYRKSALNGLIFVGNGKKSKRIFKGLMEAALDDLRTLCKGNSDLKIEKFSLKIITDDRTFDEFLHEFPAKFPFNICINSLSIISKTEEQVDELINCFDHSNINELIGQTSWNGRESTVLIETYHRICSDRQENCEYEGMKCRLLTYDYTVTYERFSKRTGKLVEPMEVTPGAKQIWVCKATGESCNVDWFCERDA